MSKGSNRFLVGCAAISAFAATLVSTSGLAMAAPTYTPFLSVDFDGSPSGSSTYAPAQSGFQTFDLASPVGAPSVTNNYTINSSTYGVTLAPSAAASGTAANFTSRDRGANGSTDGSSNLTRAFALELRDTSFGLGTAYLQETITGLTPNATYEYTGFSEDQNSAGSGTNRDGYSTIAPASYQPATGNANAPTGAAYHYTPFMAAPSTEYAEAVSFDATASATGALTIYVYGDTDSYSNQTATITNGFQLGVVPAAIPEPTTVGVIGFAAAALVRRRRPRA